MNDAAALGRIGHWDLKLGAPKIEPWGASRREPPAPFTGMFELLLDRTQSAKATAVQCSLLTADVTRTAKDVRFQCRSGHGLVLIDAIKCNQLHDGKSGLKTR